jgi:metal-responsive CopG/Arc/MetJ family transcriptional regulator
MSRMISRTTLALPTDLLARVDHAVHMGKARSRNSFVATALRRELAAIERAEIDADFALMADDDEYQAEATRIVEEFAVADWEVLRLAEERS